jgi:hypothetical protein
MHIPQKYGLSQDIGDTVNPAGIFRFLRTAPVQLETCWDMEEICPDALLLNYTNPMSMLTWIHSEGSDIANVGLCHSVQGTTQMLAKFAGIPYDDVSYLVAGINHQAWVLEFFHKQQNAYPLILKAIQGTAPPLTLFGTDYPTKDGTNVRDYIHVEDLAEAHILAMEKLSPGESIFANLGTGRGFSVKEIIATAEKVTGKKVPVTFGPRRPGDAIALYAEGLADAVIDGKASIPEVPSGDDEFVELDDAGKPKVEARPKTAPPKKRARVTKVRSKGRPRAEDAPPEGEEEPEAE